MAYFASCNGLPIVGGQLLIPRVGAWTADLHLATQQPVSGAATVVIGNLTLAGAVFRSDVYGGQVRARLVGGAGGWRTSIPAQGYGNPAGVKLSTVLNDAAGACGEKVSIAADASIGNAFVRVNFDTSVASDVLWELVARGIIAAWYVAPNGVTQTAAWPSAAITTPFTVVDQRPDEGVVVVATEDYASWMPGCTFTAPQLSRTYTSAGVHYVWGDDGTFRFEVLTGSSEDRVLSPLQQMIQKEIAGHRFFGRYEYSVSSPTSTTIDGSPTDTTLGLPDLQNVLLCSDSIATYTPSAGSKAHVQFLNGSPMRPICVWTDQTPTVAQLLGGANPVARQGDLVQSFLPPTLPVTFTSGPASPGTGFITVASPISGVIAQGSPTVSTE